LNALVAMIRADNHYPDLHSLLIVRHGYLVIEEYFDGHGPDEVHMQQSVSKSFTSALVGIAMGRGEFKNVDERVLDFFTNLPDIENVSDRKRAITIEDLLTMRSGTDYHERGPASPHFQLNRLDRGWTRFILSRPMVTDPGSTFQYDSGAVILMSSLLRERTGHHAHVLAKRWLFEPLGIKRFDWYTNADGHPHTGGGLQLSSRDMAKFGLLFLRNGRWEDRQVVPATWVKASTRRQVEFGNLLPPFTGYGYWWWTLPPDPADERQTDIYWACGFRAQYIFVLPAQDMVVVVTGGTRRHADQQKPLSFLYSHILAAIPRGN
jgi:CubicO group peptidase (beta-lactamase class C family)